jgi:hypothetical protein
MNLNQLFRLKEEMLKDLALSVENMSFKDEETKAKYYFTSMEAIMDFYTKAMIVIINNESNKSRAA